MRLGLIGAGNMGGAIIKGFAAGMDAGDSIIVFDLDRSKTDEVRDLPGLTVADDMNALLTKADFVLIALKPNIFDKVIPEIAAISRDKVYISIAAGVSISYMLSHFGPGSKIVRVMPNTPAMVGAGVAALAKSDSVTDAEFSEVMRIFGAVGKAVSVSEDKFDIITGISGSSPAYAYMYIQALIGKAVEKGLGEDEAKSFAVLSTIGAAKMLLSSEESPEQLRINVCSPGGTTIEAVHKLEEEGFIPLIKDAVEACITKSEKMRK